MTYFKQQREEIEKGCGKETTDLEGEVRWICKKEPKGVFIECAEPLSIEGIKKICKSPQIEFKYCSRCQAKLNQLNKDEDAVRKGFNEDIETIELHKENTAEVMHCDDIIMILKGRKEELGLNEEEKQ